MLTWKDIADVEQRMQRENTHFASLIDMWTRTADLLNERLAMVEVEELEQTIKIKPNCF
jgi:hypothetical protein